jgi:DNA polymerase-3 subunit delta'
MLEQCLALARRDALPATLLLVGEPGLGREALAVELAAALVCRKGQEIGCACPSCARVRKGVHPDVEIIDVLPDKNAISIDQARQLVNGIISAPFEGLRRVFIIASGHNPPLGEHASSALLKTLEEPPSHATLILLAANPGRVLPTIVSRSVALRVPPPTREELVELIASVRGCQTEISAQLLESVGDPGALLRSDDDMSAQASELRSVLPAAVSGDGLAILRLGALLRRYPDGIVTAARFLLDETSRQPADTAEGLLDAAAALLAADFRRATLNLDIEATVVGAMAALTR